MALGAKGFSGAGVLGFWVLGLRVYALATRTPQGLRLRVWGVGLNFGFLVRIRLCRDFRAGVPPADGTSSVIMKWHNYGTPAKAMHCSCSRKPFHQTPSRKHGR